MVFFFKDIIFQQLELFFTFLKSFFVNVFDRLFTYYSAH